MDFAVGTPRSGTAHLAYILSEAGNLASRHEYLVGRDGNQIVTVPTAYYEGRADAARARELVRSYRNHPPIDLDACWKLSWVLPPLYDEFPGAKLVHIVRDPRTNVRACYNIDYYGSMLSTIWRDNFPNIKRSDWDSLGQLERNCAFWTETHRLILEASRGRPYMLVRHEELTDPAVVTELLKFFDVPLPPPDRLAKVLATHVDTLFGVKHKVETMRTERNLDVLPRYENWPESAKQTLLRLCGEMAARLGYSLGD